MNTIKTTVKIAGFLLVVLLALGCGGTKQGPMSSLNPHAVASGRSGNPASSKFLYLVKSIEETVQGLAVDAATGALTGTSASVPIDHSLIYATAALEGKFINVANARSEAIESSGYRIDGLRGELMAMAPVECLARRR